MPVDASKDFEVVLDGHADAGYIWQYESGVAVLLGMEWGTVPGPPGVVGTSAPQRFRFNAMTVKGRWALSFVARRPWEPWGKAGDPRQMVIVEVP